MFVRKAKYARRITQLLVGLYMLVYLGLICRENMQIEGFWYYLFTGVFEAAVIGLCDRFVSGKCPRYRTDYVPGIYYRKCALLRSRHFSCVSA